MTQQEQDRKDLKIQAYRERVSKLTLDYEEQVAELRVELTVVSQERDALLQERADLQQRLLSLEEVTYDKDEFVSEEKEDE